MAGSRATRSSRGHRTLWLPLPEESSQPISDDPRAFRRTLDDSFQRMPELFPRNFPGYQLMGHRVSAKQGVMIRRVRLKDGTTSSIRPSFLMPDMTARTEDVQGPLFLRTFGVPFWALAHVFGRDPMYWGSCARIGEILSGPLCGPSQRGSQHLDFQDFPSRSAQRTLQERCSTTTLGT